MNDTARFAAAIFLTALSAIHGFSPLDIPRFDNPAFRWLVQQSQIHPSRSPAHHSSSFPQLRDDALLDIELFNEWSMLSIPAACLAVILFTTEPALAAPAGKAAFSSTAAQIHLNSLPPSTISVQIDDLPVIGSLLSGTYSRVVVPAYTGAADADGGSSSSSSTKAVPVTIRSPADKAGAIANIATAGHLEFDVDGMFNTHLDVDVAVSTPGVATIKVDSPLIPLLPFRNAASDLVPPAARALKLAKRRPPPLSPGAASAGTGGGSATTTSATAAQVSVTGLPPTAISVEIQDLPVLGRALSGVYTKVDDKATTASLLSDDAPPASVTIESPRDKIAAIRAIASKGHMEFDIDGVLTTHVDVDIATDAAGSATIRVASPLIPALPFQNSASY